MNTFFKISFRKEHVFKAYALVLILIVAIEKYWLYPSYKSCEEVLYPLFYNTNILRIGFILLPLCLHLLLYGKTIGFRSIFTDISISLLALGFIAAPEYQLIYFFLALFGSLVFSKTSRKVALFIAEVVALALGFALTTAVFVYLIDDISMALIISSIAALTSLFIKRMRWQAVSGCMLILVCLSLMPNSLGYRRCSPGRIITANMHTFQTIIETYGVDHNGTYPTSSKEIFIEAINKGYWKDFINPITGTSGYGKSFADLEDKENKSGKEAKRYSLDVLGIRFAERLNNNPGKAKVLYKRVSKSQYVIYAEDDKSDQLFQDTQAGEPFSLTNAY